MPVHPLRIAVVGLATAALAVAAAAQAFAGFVGMARPDAALAVWPGSGQALTRQAEYSLALALSKKGRYATAAAEARRALEVHGLNARALQVLGLVATENNDRSEAARYMALSSQLSRRNGLVQIWLVDQAARNGDSAAALAHFDTAMRTSPTFSAQLYPILANALQAPDIRKEFVPFVRGNASWLAPFVGFAADQSPRPDALAKAIVEAGGLPPGEQFRGSVALLLDKLSLSGMFADMAALYRVEHRGADPALTSLGFGKDGIDARFAPIAWRFPAEGDVQVSQIPVAGRSAPALRFEAFDTRSQEAARKFLFLKPGTYRLAHAARRLAPGAGKLELVLACANRAVTRLASIDLTVAKGAKRVAVPAGCATQVAVLKVTGATGEEGFDLALDALEISPT